MRHQPQYLDGAATPEAAPPAIVAAEAQRLEQDAIVEGLRRGDRILFDRLFRDHSRSMVARARAFVRDREVAEEVVQETWMAVLDGIGSFEGKSSLRTWVLSILANKARTRARRERRSVPVSSVAGDGETADLDRLEAAASWMEPLHAIDVQDPERIVGGRECLGRVASLVEALPESQRAVVMMRDIEGRSAEETAELLGISAGNQRVLLHRGHQKLREIVAQHRAGA